MLKKYQILAVISLITGIILSGCVAATPPATEPPTQAAVTEKPTEKPAPTPTMAPSPTAAPSPTPEPTAAMKSLVFTDDLGRQVELPATAQKIVSLAPSNTEILYAIGAGNQVVGRDAFSDYPAEAQSLPDVGGGWGELNNELIVSLQPDLVLAAQINTAEQVKTLEDLGLTVYYLANPKELEGLYTNLQTVARLTGREAETESLIADLQTRVSAVEEKLAAVTDRPLIFYELDSTDPNAPYTSGPGTFIDLLISMAGGENLGHDMDGEWVQVSVEDLITKNPEIILLGDYVWGGVKPEDVAARPGWQAIAAVQNKQVLPFDDNLVSRPGPRLVDGLEELAKLLHPELFQ
jgi:iron complex transport system substrate-binding protein